MTRDEFDRFCAALPGAGNVVQWGGASVWKVGVWKGGGPKRAKVFAIYSHWGESGGIVLKPSEMAREIWRGTPGVARAPYLGRAGWIIVAPGAIGAGDLGALIEASHGLNAAKLTRAERAAIGMRAPER